MSTWKCEEPVFKNVSLEKEFTPYPHFLVYHFEAVLAPLNKHPTDDLTYLSKHIPIYLEPVYLVDENPERLIATIH